MWLLWHQKNHYRNEYFYLLEGKKICIWVSVIWKALRGLKHTSYRTDTVKPLKSRLFFTEEIYPFEQRNYFFLPAFVSPRKHIHTHSNTYTHTQSPINLSNRKWDEIFYHSNGSNCRHTSAKCTQPTGVEHPGTHLPAGWLELRQTAVSTSRIRSQSSGYSFWRKRYLFSGQPTHTQTSRKYTQKMSLLFGPNTPKSQGKWEGFSEEIKQCRKLKSHHFMNT